MTRFIKILAILLVFTGASAAQAYTNTLEYGTNQVVSTDWTNTVITVGGFTSSNTMTITSGSFVTNLMTVIGSSSNANQNAVFVEDGSEWGMSGDLYVGSEGSSNYLEIAGGADVINADAYVGELAGASNNLVVVTNSGSSWTINGALNIGGISNEVTVVSGGRIEADDLSISTNGSEFYLGAGGTFSINNDFDVSTTGFVWNAGGHLELTGELTGMGETNGAVYLDDGRDLTLSGAGAEWSSSTNDLILGYESVGSVLTITNGSLVESKNGFIGWGDTSSNNAVLVSDAGSTWTNSGSLYLGAYGDVTNMQDTGFGNALIVTNQAWVHAGDASSADVGADTNGGIIVASTGGSELMVDTGSFALTDGTLYLGSLSDTNNTGSATVQNAATIQVENLLINPNGVFNLNQDGTLVVTGDFDVDAVSNRFNWASNSELEVQGELTLDQGLEGTDRTLRVAGDDANWDITGAIVSGSNGMVIIESGAGVTNTAGGITGVRNTVVVQGTDAHWLNLGTLTATGDTNTVYVQSGGTITANAINFTGSNELNLNTDGTLVITDTFDWLASSNLNWNSGGNLQIEGELTGMETVTNVINGNSNVVATIIDAGRDLTLSGGSWSNASNDRIIGYESSGSNLEITNGAKVVNLDGYIGWGSSSANNSVLVSGTNSIWQNSGGNLYLGAYWADGTNLTATGSGNVLAVADDAKVFVGDVTNNVVGMLVAGTTGATFTVWNSQAFINDTLSIGLGTNAFGTVSITNGGDLSVGDLVITNGSTLLLGENSTFRIATNFNQHAWEGNGFVWDATNSTLEVGGDLTRTNYYLDKGQDLILSGAIAGWDIGTNTLVIGLDGSSELVLEDGAELLNGDTFIGATANTNQGSHGVYMYEGAKWTSTGELSIGNTSSNNFMAMYSGSQADFSGSVNLGNDSTRNAIFLAGSNTLLKVGGDLNVGSSSTNSVGNNLTVSGLARLEVTSNVVINAGNSITMSGGATNSLGGNFTVSSNAALLGTGTVEFDTAFSSLILEDGNGFIDSAIIFEGNNSDVEVNGGLFYVAGSNSNQFRNFQTLGMTNAALVGYGTNDAFSIINMYGGEIAPNLLEGQNFSAATLVIDGAFNASSNVTYKAQLLGTFGNDLLEFTGGVDLTNMVADVYIGNAVDATNTILTAAGGLTNDFASYTITNGLLLWDAELAVVGNDVQIVLTNNTEAFSSSLDYAGTEAVRAGFSGMKNAVFTRTKQLRRNLVSTAHSMPHDAFLMTNTNSPAGPQGPGADNTIFDMHIWAQYFNGQGEYDDHGNSYGFTLNNSGTTIGADKLIGDALVVGFNYTYTRANALTTNTDFLDSETYWLGAYSEWVNNSGLFVDGLLAYGWSNYDSVRVETGDGKDYEGISSYNGDALGAYIDVGQYMYYKNLSIAPYAGLHMLFVGTDDRNETNISNDSGSQIKVHGIDRNIVESALGLKGRHRFDTRVGRFQTTGFAEWTHDFVQDEVASTLQADSVAGLRALPVTMSAIKPESDLFNVGLGLSWRNTEYMEVGVGYNGRFSKNYEEHTGSLMLDIMF